MEKKPDKNNGQLFLGVCRKCRIPFKRMEDKCECRPYLCYHCCECDMDCDLCNCKHKK